MELVAQTSLRDSITDLVKRLMDGRCRPFVKFMGIPNRSNLISPTSFYMHPAPVIDLLIQ